MQFHFFLLPFPFIIISDRTNFTSGDTTTRTPPDDLLSFLMIACMICMHWHRPHQKHHYQQQNIDCQLRYYSIDSNVKRSGAKSGSGILSIPSIRYRDGPVVLCHASMRYHNLRWSVSYNSVSSMHGYTDQQGRWIWSEEAQPMTNLPFARHD